MVAIALLQVRAAPWETIYKKGQLPTWVSNKPNSIEVINVFGKTPSSLIRKFDVIHEKLRWIPQTQLLVNLFDRFLSIGLRKINTPRLTILKDKNVTNLLVDVPSTNLTLPNVEIGLFKYFLESTTADFLYISNTSSYLNLKKFLETIESFPDHKVYGGTIVELPELKFASGANRIISRDLVQYLVDNFKKWEFQYLCDLSMGKFLSGQVENEVLIPSLSFTTIAEIENADENILKQTPHFRLKSGPLTNRIDDQLMIRIHKIIGN